jgi:hypothetical protein
MLPKWLQNKTIAVWDIEADRIPSTEIYCISVSILYNGEVIERAKVFTQYWTPYSNGSLMQAVSMINACDFQSGHNTIGYDIPMIQLLLRGEITPPSLDTLLLSKIVFSKDDLFAMDAELGVDKDLWGGYSAKAFGQRMGDFKIDFDDFSKLTEEMTVYCNQDTDLTARLLTFLMDKPNFPIEEVVKIESEAATVIAEQTSFGFYLDIGMAKVLNTRLLKEKGEIARELADIFSPKFLKDGPEKHYTKPSKIRKYLPDERYIPVW